MHPDVTYSLKNMNVRTEISNNQVVRKRLFIISVLIVLMVTLWFFSGGWFWGKPVRVESTQILMDTTFIVTVYAKDRKTGEQLIRDAFEEARRIEHIMEPLKGDGELKRINDSIHEGWYVMSPDLRAVMEQSLKYYNLSGGVFDPTIAPVKWLWDFEDGGKVPSGDELKEKLKTVGMSLVELHGDSLRFKNSGMRLDLGGVAKGYTVDRMLDILRKEGSQSVLINAGGDIDMFGKKPGDEDWVIGLRHPRMNRTLILDTIPYPSVATSGDYERYFVENGERYHHILDPTTGYPARGCISVTVWASSATLADILSTTIFVLGPGKGLAFAESLGHVETLIFFEKNGKVESAMTSGIKGKVRL